MSSERRRIIGIIALLWLMVATIYFPAARYGFIALDDPENIRDNPHLRAGLTQGDLHWAMTGYLMGHWTPLVRLTYLTDQTFFHLNPEVMHVEDIAIHAAASSMLFILMLTATGAIWRSAIVAAIFAVHPMHVESVVWLTERRDVMSAVFLFAAIWAYVRYCRADSIGRPFWYLCALLIYALSLMSKAMGITLPLILLLLDIWPLQRAIDSRDRVVAPIRGTRLLLEKLSFAILAIATAIAAMHAQHAVGAEASFDDLPLAWRLGNAAVTFPIYIAKLILPTRLAVFYQHPGEWPTTAVGAGSLLLIGMTIFAIQQRKRRPYLAAGWFWFLIMMLPVSGFTQAGAQSMADRYSYIPSVGLCLAVVWLLNDLARLKSPSQQYIATVFTILLLVILAFIARQQVRYWRDSESLYDRAIEVTGSNYFAHRGLADLAADRGDLRTAIAEYNRSIEDRPKNPEAFAGLGNCWRADPREAVKYFRQAVACAPHRPKYRIALAATLVQLDDLPGAEMQLRSALADDPQNSAALAGLADVQVRASKK